MGQYFGLYNEKTNTYYTYGGQKSSNFKHDPESARAFMQLMLENAYQPFSVVGDYATDEYDPEPKYVDLKELGYPKPWQHEYDPAPVKLTYGDLSVVCTNEEAMLFRQHYPEEREIIMQLTIRMAHAISTKIANDMLNGPENTGAVGILNNTPQSELP